MRMGNSDIDAKYIINTFRYSNLNSILISKKDENKIAKNLDNNLPNFVINAVLSECIRLGKLKRSGKYIHSAGRIAKMSKRDQMNWEKIENIFTSSKFSPPIVSDLASILGMEVKVLQDLLSENSKRRSEVEKCLLPLNKCYNGKAFNVSEYTDFYSCKNHALNRGG